MHTKMAWLGLCCIGILLAGCGEKKGLENELILDEKYQKIDHIHSFANCDSPQGEYTTELLSYTDGTFYFTQIVDADNPLFKVKLDSENKAFLLDSLDNVLDTLPKTAALMIRGHDFHRIQTQPEKVFRNVMYSNNKEGGLDVFTGKDNLDNEVKLYYDRKARHISHVEMINPVDTTQLIEIIHQDWLDTDFGKMAKEIAIIQAGTDTFFFDFQYVKINEDVN